MRRYWWLVLVCAFALSPTSAYGFDIHYQACFSPSGGWGVPAPVIDGVLTNESGWANTFQYRFQNGSADADVKLLATSAGNKIYVAIEVQGDTSYDALDTVLLAFQVGATSHHVIVHPFPDTPSPTGPPLTVYYDQSTWSGSGLVHFGGTPHAVTPSDPVETVADDPGDGKFRVWTTASGISSGVGSWTTEIAIPLGDGTDQLPLSLGTDIGMYVAVSRAMNTAGSPTSYYSWPNSLWSNTSTLDLDHDLPDPTQWGVARIGSLSTCNGLRVTGVRTLDPDNMANDTELSLTNANAFRLTVSNNSVDAGGNGVGVTGVTAKFSVGRWGVPLSWRNVASSSPATTVPADSSATIDSPAAYIPTATDLANGHVCLLGEVETTQGDATISQKSIIINTHWGPASTFTDHPVIQSSLLRPPAGKTTNTLVIRHLSQRQFAYSAGEIPAQRVGALTAQLNWRFDVFHAGGRTLVVNGVHQPVYTPLGTFHEIVRHELPSKFSDEFSARHQAQLKRVMAGQDRSERSRDADPQALQRQQLRALNEILAGDQEKPSEKDFTVALKAQGMSRMARTDNMFQIEVPQGKDISLETIATSNMTGGTGGPPVKTCASCSFAGGSDAAGGLALVLAVALALRRRRRPRR